MLFQIPISFRREPGGDADGDVFAAAAVAAAPPRRPRHPRARPEEHGRHGGEGVKGKPQIAPKLQVW